MHPATVFHVLAPEPLTSSHHVIDLPGSLSRDGGIELEGCEILRGTLRADAAVGAVAGHQRAAGAASSPSRRAASQASWPIRLPAT
jgi:hypothetical protein